MASIKESERPPLGQEAGPPVRLFGVDLMRGFAAFGVVVIHAHFGIGVPMTALVNRVSDFFTFAVPFFLWTSLYFAAETRKTSWTSLRARLGRLLVPYFIWSVIYEAARIAKYVFFHRSGEVSRVLAELPFDLLRGSIAMHLYFLPLLCIGTILVFWLRPVFSKAHVVLGCAALVAACAAQAWLRPSLVAGENDPGMPGAVTTVGEWVLRCLPIAIAVLLIARRVPRGRFSAFPLSWALVIAVASILAQTTAVSYIPPGTWDIFAGFSWFLIGCGLSQWVRAGAFIRALGASYFGIYLVHHLIIELLQVAMSIVIPTYTYLTDLPRLIFMALAGFAISFALVWYAGRRSAAGRFLFAMEPPAAG